MYITKKLKISDVIATLKNVLASFRAGPATETSTRNAEIYNSTPFNTNIVIVSIPIPFMSAGIPTPFLITPEHRSRPVSNAFLCNGLQEKTGSKMM
jgi:hypothetical protein